MSLIEYEIGPLGAFVVSDGIGSEQEAGLLSKKQCTHRLEQTTGVDL